MKRKDIKELHHKTREELFKLAREVRQEFGKLNIELSLAKLKNTNLLRQKKKDLARILTILAEKEIVEK